MKREVDLKDISDGRLYTANDMVKADCHNCAGCSACCSGMGESLVLDPLDVHRLCDGLNVTFEKLLDDKIEFNVVDGITLPNIKMNESCGFLSNEGRCSIHNFRPGICRLFPLGRFYEEDGFKYFIQVHECPVKNKGKVKVKKWIDVPELKQYEEYIWQWHKFISDCQEALSDLDREQIRVLHLFILRTFYQNRYSKEFYQDFYARLENARKTLGLV